MGIHLYYKCKSVTLMSNWWKFGEIVPFGGSPPQPTTLPTVAVACSHKPPLGNALDIYSYSKLLRGRGSFTQLIRIWEFQTHTVFCVKYFHISSLPCILGMYTAERMDAHESSWWESWRLRAFLRDEGMDCTMYIPSDRFSLTLTEEWSWIKPDTPLLLAVNIIFNTLIGCQTEKLRIEICLLLAAAPFGIGGSLRLEGDSRMNKW